MWGHDALLLCCCFLQAPAAPEVQAPLAIAVNHPALTSPDPGEAAAASALGDGARSFPVGGTGGSVLAGQEKEPPVRAGLSWLV